MRIIHEWTYNKMAFRLIETKEGRFEIVKRIPHCTDSSPPYYPIPYSVAIGKEMNEILMLYRTLATTPDKKI